MMTLNDPHLVLASASPRRLELLTQLGVKCHVQVADIDETPAENELAEALVERLAIQKALHVSELIMQSNIAKQDAQNNITTSITDSNIEADLSRLPVLGSDTIGLCEGKILVKPANFDDARNMLRLMSGNWHDVLTSVAICYRADQQNGQQSTTQNVSTNQVIKYSIVNKTRVLLRKISDSEIESYWKSGEPQGKAGSYAIQGLGAQFVKEINGSYSGVMGLPLFETAELLKKASIDVLAINALHKQHIK